MRDGKQYRVDGDIKPLGIHEIKHSDAKYYYDSRMDLRASTTKAKSGQDRKRRNAVKTKVPHWGSDSETDMEESLPSSDDSSSSEGKSVPMVDLDTPPHSLAIITMPEKHLKDLTPREVHRVEELKTFFVPPATRFVNGKRITHRGILFYKSAGNLPEVLKSQVMISATDVSQVPPLRSCSKGLLHLFKRMGCLEPLSREAAEWFLSQLDTFYTYYSTDAPGFRRRKSSS